MLFPIDTTVESCNKVCATIFLLKQVNYCLLFVLCVATLVANLLGVTVLMWHISNYIAGSLAQRCSLHQTLWGWDSLMTYIVGNGAAQLVHSWSCLCNFLCSADNIRRILQWPFPPGERKSKDQSLFLIYCSLIQYAGAASLSWNGCLFFSAGGKYG